MTEMNLFSCYRFKKPMNMMVPRRSARLRSRNEVTISNNNEERIQTFGLASAVEEENFFHSDFPNFKTELIDGGTEMSVERECERIDESQAQFPIRYQSSDFHTGRIEISDDESWSDQRERRRSQRLFPRYYGIVASWFKRTVQKAGSEQRSSGGGRILSTAVRRQHIGEFYRNPVSLGEWFYTSRSIVKCVKEEIMHECSAGGGSAAASGCRSRPSILHSWLFPLMFLLPLLLGPLALLGAYFVEVGPPTALMNTLYTIENFGKVIWSQLHNESVVNSSTVVGEGCTGTVLAQEERDKLFARIENLEKKYNELKLQKLQWFTACRCPVTENANIYYRDEMLSTREQLMQLHQDLKECDRRQVQLQTLINNHEALFNSLDLKLRELSTVCQREQTSVEVSKINGVSVSVSDVDAKINLALKRYDADRTMMPDFALESSGGSVLSIRCTETYDQRVRVVTLFGIPLYYKAFSPRIVIQPGIVPGECWAFKGSVGSLVIKLSGVINVTSFSYEHVSKFIATDGNIESAPREFEVYGLMSKHDENPQLLGQYTYDDMGDPLQHFPVTAANITPVPIVEFKIIRNYGHPKYTCLYRFRVHGERIYIVYWQSNFMDKTQTSRESIGLKYVLSCAAATLAETATYPLDLLKTRLQIQGEHGKLNSQFMTTPKQGMFTIFSNIVRKEGFFGLWNGITPAVTRHYDVYFFSVYTGVRVIFYETFREKLFHRNADGTFDLWKAMCSSMASGAIGQFLASPTDLVKVQMQMEGRRRLDGLPPRVENMFQAFRQTFASGGIPALWKGWLPNCQRAAIVNMADISTYDTVKHSLLKHTQLPDNYVTHGISSAFSGLAAAITSTPVDVVKTRMMNQTAANIAVGERFYKSSIDCLLKTISNEGFFALYKGFVPIWARMAPWSLTFWVSYERIRWLTGASSF
ncbi:Mitochondrial uncoupling protein 4 [Trichinella britovi]|uniref:Mitochondrial uncoupling protein 4 n=1 Tax=Trichinella britovi TaxID=45882 RepID=A0A0V1D8J6_TRIBR|nr:Mitochondrial uncoupling protein 4 [Trichinella britovi]